jgi:hypothetical protein
MIFDKMERKDKLTIERWELEEILDTFRLLTNVFPIIKNRDTCLDRKLMDSYARLTYLYNGEEYGSKEHIKYYMGNGKVPELKK